MRNLERWMLAACLGVSVGALSLVSEAAAQNYSFPLIECNKNGGCYVTAYYDLNRGSGLRDWNCKSKTYNNHSGTDYGIGGFGGMDSNGSRPAVAAADGTVVSAVDGNYDRNTSSNYQSYCGTSSSCGNFVKIKHADGKHTIYCHMKKGTVKVKKGQNVKCGQELGRVGSSGCSTGPHLHFGVYLKSGSTDDPYAATSSSCGGQTSYWISQGAYLGLPTYSCCTPNCSGKNCGGDGCGGSCGSCSGQSVCENSKCVCKPNCSGKQCGGDGCGGSCGSCSGQDVCENNKCVCKPNCNGKNCGGDGCGGSCGSCSGQDVCENSKCVCKPKCDGKQCGPDGCGGSCGTCPGSQDVCNDGKCVCVPNCEGRECGDDGCGGTCGSCPDGYACGLTGACECVPQCDGRNCGSDSCGGVCGECTGYDHCDFETGVCKCDPKCEGRECGDDECGGSCGECPGSNDICDEYACVCVPDCAGRDCGDDGCGGSCGNCETGYECSANQCVISVCRPNCDGRKCGDDGCGGSCGICGEDESCQDGVCQLADDGIEPAVRLVESDENCGCSQIQKRPSVPVWPFILSMIGMIPFIRRRKREE
ncbi:MAG: M23 family metallopeptidase [Proteobacteria bacterium]|nr:M23 family metallopeptidase [Pseudomonadota bacterium]